jgi:uncharacterized protein (DUF924 family)
MTLRDDWVGDVLKFWFEQTKPDQWFEKDAAFDASVRERFLSLHESLVSRGSEGPLADALLADAQIALAAVIVLDQMSRNMFRDTPRAHSPPIRWHFRWRRPPSPKDLTPA